MAKTVRIKAKGSFLCTIKTVKDADGKRIAIGEVYSSTPIPENILGTKHSPNCKNEHIPVNHIAQRDDVYILFNDEYGAFVEWDYDLPNPIS